VTSPRILCLHYLVQPGDKRPRRLAVPAEALVRMVAREHETGRRPGRLADAVADPSRFALTFDDAHVSLLTAIPILREHDVRPTVFVATDFVGTSDEFLTWEGLRALRDAGWNIGGHSRRHARASWRFYDEDDRAVQQRLDDEAVASREELEQRLGITVHDYAYPFGEVTAAARTAVAKAGYTRAFTVRESTDWDGDPFAIPRLDGMEAHGLIEARSADPTHFSVVIPACDRHEMLREVIACWSAQSYPAEAFEVLVVDDGSRTSLRPCVEGLGATNVRLIEGAGDASTFDAGAARQRGVREARFDTLAFVDADVAVGRDFLWHLDWVHQRVEDAVVIGYLSGYNLHDIGFVHSPDDLRKHADPDELPIIPDRSREPALRACLDNLDWLEEPWRLAYTGNLSVTRRVLERAGGFARDFSGWGLEDLDLGYRLHRSTAPFVFSRFAVGHHLVDPSELSRNPFRASNPTRERFAGYEKNLAVLAKLHGSDPTIERFVEQTRRDIDETCSQPRTVGVELGGRCSLDCAFHRRLHRCQPGGVDTYDLLDRLAYAVKVGARALYLLGGDPAEHPGFLPLLGAARAAGLRVTTETTALPFAADGFAHAAREAGLQQVVVEILALDEALFDAMSRTTGRFPRFLAGLESLEAAGIELRARLVVDPAHVASLPRTLGTLRDRKLALAEVVSLSESPTVENVLREAGFVCRVRPPLL
jgi:glycosyltransferase involved in cell wall biosynthesis/peptidoglycan/xylan/chitin deacetylase (PgdA/CDA1 family)